MPLEVISMIAFGKKEANRRPADINNLRWEKVHIGKYRLESASSEQEEK
jgi:hypothetical protein